MPKNKTAAVIGLGHFGIRHAMSYLQHAQYSEITRIVFTRTNHDNIKESVSKLRTIAEAEHTIPVSIEGYENIGSLVNNETVNYVSITTPTGYHYNAIHTLLNSSKKVGLKGILVEKPFILITSNRFYDHKHTLNSIDELFSITKQNNVWLDEDVQLVYDAREYRKRLKHEADEHEFEIYWGTTKEQNLYELWLDIGPHVISILQEAGFDINSYNNLSLIKLDNENKELEIKIKEIHYNNENNNEKHEMNANVLLNIKYFQDEKKLSFGFKNHVCYVTWNSEKHGDELTINSKHYIVKNPLSQKIKSFLKNSQDFNSDRLKQKSSEIVSRMNLLLDVWQLMR